MQNTNNNPQAINRAFEERATREQADTLGIPYIDVSEMPINPDVLKLVPVEKSEVARVIPFRKIGKKLFLAATTPQSEETKELVEWLKKKGFTVEMALTSEGSFETTKKTYESHFLHLQHIETTHDFEERADATLEADMHMFQDLEKKIPALHAENILNEIEILAVTSHASDIHIQTNEHGAVLRFRIDGILHPILIIPEKQTKKLIDLIKFGSGMKTNIYDMPQDGHLTFKANDRSIDLRVATLPTEFSESVVMRILDSNKGIKKFPELGFDEAVSQKIRTAILQKNGMTLVTGPTGSGKTTTLYSMLAELNTPDKKIVTLEDPIEYHLDGVTQSQVNEKRDYNFSNGLRALLRHDPDVVLIGEIREISTARLSSEAALTGHTVLSSLHTNSAIGAITRLRNLGLESYNIASSVNAVFAQRLVRTLCPHCHQKIKIKVSQEKRLFSAMQRIQAVGNNAPDTVEKDPTIEVLEPVGCDKCSHTGYFGQTAITESLLFTPEIKEQIVEGNSEIEILNYCRKNTDFLSLFENGVQKVLNQETSLQELFRVVA